MKKLFKSTLVLLTLIFSSSYAEQSKVEIVFFGSSTCSECLQIKEILLYPLEKKFPDDLKLTLYDTEQDSALALLLEFENRYKTNSNAAQMLFLPDTFVAGFEDIMAKGYSLITERIKNKEKYSSNHHKVW